MTMDYRPSAIGGVIRGFGFLSAILEYKNKNGPFMYLSVLVLYMVYIIKENWILGLKTKLLER